MLKKIKGLTIREPKFLSINTKAHLQLSASKYPADFVETLIEERKKQLMKEKHVQENKV